MFQTWIFSQLENLQVRPYLISSCKDSGQDAQCYFWGDVASYTLYLTFRGTSSQQDMFADADITPRRLRDKKVKGIAVHNGFYNQFKSVTDEIEAVINVCRQEAFEADCTRQVKLVIAGHSLGGALAQITAAHYTERFPSMVIVCHTIGSPRVGNAAFVKWLSQGVKEYIRVANKNDPVPMMPQFPIWTHAVNKCIVINDDCTSCSPSRDVPWYSRICRAIADIDFAAPIQDHSCEEYLRRLQVLHSSQALIDLVV
jgi:predicted lipase